MRRPRAWNSRVQAARGIDEVTPTAVEGVAKAATMPAEGVDEVASTVIEVVADVASMAIGSRASRRLLRPRARSSSPPRLAEVVDEVATTVG